MSEGWSHALLIGFAFATAGLVKGVVGLGLPTVAIGLLSLAMAPVEAAALLIVPSLVTNVWQMVVGPGLRPIARRLATMMVGVFIGTLLTIGVLTGASSTLATAALGAILALYGAWGLWGRGLSVRRAAEPLLSPLMGLLTGLVAGATGVFAIPAVPYLGGLGMSKDELIQSLGLGFTVGTVALATGLALNGALHRTAAASSLLAVLPAALGMAAGQRLRHHLAPDTFRRGFYIALMALGGVMVARALWPAVGAGGH